MRPGAIKLHIDELVLHGFEPADRAALGTALETELARLLAAGDPSALTGANALARIDAGGFEMPAHSAPELTGTRLARAVYDGMTGQSARRKG